MKSVKSSAQTRDVGKLIHTDPRLVIGEPVRTDPGIRYSRPGGPEKPVDSFGQTQEVIKRVREVPGT